MPKVGLNGVQEASDFSPIPAGSYLCRLESITEKVSKNGNDVWNMKFEVVQKPEEGETSYEQRYIFDNLVFSENTLNRVKLIAKRLGGFTEEQLNAEDGIDLQKESFEGKVCILTVIIEEYEGKEKNKVTFGGYEVAENNNEETEEDNEIPF